MTNIFDGPVNELISDAAINAIDDGRSKGLADHDAREYFIQACADAFDANVTLDDADPAQDEAA